MERADPGLHDQLTGGRVHPAGTNPFRSRPGVVRWSRAGAPQRLTIVSRYDDRARDGGPVHGAETPGQRHGDRRRGGVDHRETTAIAALIGGTDLLVATRRRAEVHPVVGVIHHRGGRRLVPQEAHHRLAIGAQHEGCNRVPVPLVDLSRRGGRPHLGHRHRGLPLRLDVDEHVDLGAPVLLAAESRHRVLRAAHEDLCHGPVELADQGPGLLRGIEVPGPIAQAIAHHGAAHGIVDGAGDAGRGRDPLVRRPHGSVRVHRLREQVCRGHQRAGAQDVQEAAVIVAGAREQDALVRHFGSPARVGQLHDECRGPVLGRDLPAGGIARIEVLGEAGPVAEGRVLVDDELQVRVDGPHACGGALELVRHGRDHVEACGHRLQFGARIGSRAAGHPLGSPQFEEAGGGATGLAVAGGGADGIARAGAGGNGWDGDSGRAGEPAQGGEYAA